jgi:transposase
MIQITPQPHIFIHIDPLDFRKGIDGLIGFCQSKLAQSPFSGTVFVFRNTKGTAVKLLVYDGTGFWLMHKRFSRGALKYWPPNANPKICATNLIVILNQGRPGHLSSAWRALPSSNNEGLNAV